MTTRLRFAHEILAGRCLLSIAVVAVAVFSVAAGAQDGGVPVTCGQISDEGVCLGDTAAWCSVENSDQQATSADLLAVDCEAREAECAIVTDVGAWCVAGTGTACALSDEGRVRQLACGAVPVDNSSVCDLEGGCRTLTVACPLAAPVCVGSTLALSCATFGQALVVECGSECVEGRCIGQETGGLCDDDRLLCDDGLICVGAAVGSAGRCANDDGGDAPDVTPDTRPPFSDIGGCGHVDVNGEKNQVERAVNARGVVCAVVVLLAARAWRRRPLRRRGGELTVRARALGKPSA